MSKLKVSIANDFSVTPGARVAEEGEFPGCDFREKILLPKLQEAIESNIVLEVDLDGTAGIGTSFLEEAFGGLIRANNINYDDIKKHMMLISTEDPDYITEIEEYINDAHENN